VNRCELAADGLRLIICRQDHRYGRSQSLRLRPGFRLDLSD
jgi:hypothetical protein